MGKYVAKNQFCSFEIASWFVSTANKGTVQFVCFCYILFLVGRVQYLWLLWEDLLFYIVCIWICFPRGLELWSFLTLFNLMLLLKMYTAPGIVASHTNGEELRVGSEAQVKVFNIFESWTCFRVTYVHSEATCGDEVTLCSPTMSQHSAHILQAPTVCSECTLRGVFKQGSLQWKWR